MSNEQRWREIRETIGRQIGFGNICAISGGRVYPIDNGVEMPVSNGYSVRVIYDEGWDEYIVERVFRRGDKEWVKGRQDHVYCDELGEVAYRASCFRNGEWMPVTV